ncbi:MAG: hypothetical protein RLZZ609_1427 [Cyanobacteriota bacterium]|jgi:hypothetical protein
MTAGHTVPTGQSGQRNLRLVALHQETPPPSTSLQHASVSPTLLRLQRDLEAARAEAHNLHELLEELPAILERKFQLRLRTLLSEQRKLEDDNALLQHHLLGLLKHGAGSPYLPNLPPDGSAAATPKPDQDDIPITHGLGLRRALRLRHL